MLYTTLVLAPHLASMRSSTETSETISTGTKTQETGARCSVDLQVQQTTSNYVYTPNVHTLQSLQVSSTFICIIHTYVYVCTVCACELSILSFYHSIGSPIDGAHQVRRPIEIIWAVTVRRPLKRQRERKKVVPPGIEPRASDLSRQCSATKLRHPPTTTSQRGGCRWVSRFFHNHKHTQQISPIYRVKYV